MKKVDVGLDIGIASVGWAITNVETLEIVKHGVRLFDTMDDPKNSELENEKRREQRGLRRLVARRKTRRRDFFKCLIDHQIFNIPFDKKGEFVQTFLTKYINDTKWRQEIDIDNKGLGIFALRKKGLIAKLSKQELINVLFWYINHRGFKYEIADEKEVAVDKYYVQYKKNGELPVDIQLTFYKENGFLHGSLNRLFSTGDYLVEINQILANQGLDAKFCEAFIALFKRQRSFEQGPGNEKTPTIYGRFYDLDENDKIYKREKPLESLWDATIGKCSIYPNEFRAPKNALSSQIFNLLNDLNNLTIGGEKLSKQDKFNIIKNISLTTKSSANKITNYIKETFDLDNSNNVSGFRVDKKGTKIATPLECFFLINEVLKLEDPYAHIFVNERFNQDNVFDKIALALHKTKIVELRIQRLQEVISAFDFIDDAKIKALAHLTKGAFSETHALGFKAQREMIDIMLQEPKNQMQIRMENNQNEFAVAIKKSSYLTREWIEEVITTPTVKRALRQSINVLNAIFDFCKSNNYEVDNIVIEMARESKNKQAREMETNDQKYRENFNKQIAAFLPTGKNSSVTLKRKIWLLEQQHKHDAYTGEEISWDKLVTNQHNYDIDHIIPYSLSHDNSMNNWALTHKDVNSKKGQNTPYLYLSKLGQFEKMAAMWNKWYSPSSNTGDRQHFASREKLQYLTTPLDFTNPENQLGFIQRNLVDTRYTTRALLNFLNEYKKVNNQTYTVKTINGKMTAFARRKLENLRSGYQLNRPKGCGDNYDPKTKQKNRIWNGHHAEDAYLVTILNNSYRDQKIIERIISTPIRYDKFASALDEKAREKQQERRDATITTNFSDLEGNLDFAREELNKKMHNVTFSKKVTKKQNIKFFNETLYSGRMVDDEHVQQVSRKILTELTKLDTQKYFDDASDKKHRESLTIYHNNRPLYNGLKTIYENNKNEKFPFQKACERANEHFVKVSIEQKGKNSIYEVKKLRIYGPEKATYNVIFAPNNQNSFYESLNWVRLEIYKNRKNQWEVIPITAANSTFVNHKIIPNERMNKWKEIMNIDANAQPQLILYKNDVLKDLLGQFWVVVGHMSSQKKIEIKPIWRQMGEGSTRFIMTLNTGLKGWKFVKLNILGNFKDTKFVF